MATTALVLAFFFSKKRLASSLKRRAKFAASIKAQIKEKRGQIYFSNLKNYLDDANYVIKNGTFVPEMNGYARLIGGEGSAKYGFVGLDRNTGNITTFHVKSVSELARKAPSLGLSR